MLIYFFAITCLIVYRVGGLALNCEDCAYSWCLETDSFSETTTYIAVV